MRVKDSIHEKTKKNALKDNLQGELLKMFGVCSFRYFITIKKIERPFFRSDPNFLRVDILYQLGWVIRIYNNKK